MTRYPKVRVRVRTPNPLVLVASVRQELRRAGVERSEIRRFSDEALANDSPEGVRRICSEWVDTGARRT